MRRSSAAVAAFLLCLGAASLTAPPTGAETPPHQRPRSKSYRYQRLKGKTPRKRGKTRRKAPAAPTAPTILGVRPVRVGRRYLAPGRWRPEVRDALDFLIESEGRESSYYMKEDPPVALFSWDDIAVHGNLSDALFYRLVERAEFKFGEDFWKLLPIQYGGQRIRAGYEGFVETSSVTWKNSAYYRMYRKDFLKCYQSLCREWGVERCSMWQVRLLRDFSEDELKGTIEDVLREELRAPIREERIEEFAGDPAPVLWRRGLRKIPEMEDLFAKLREHGFDIWVLGGSNQWAVETFAKEYDVHMSRIIGIRTRMDEDRLTDTVLVPVPQGAGKVEMMVMFIGRSPALAVGGEGDGAMLRFGRGTRLMITEPDRSYPGFERKRRWLEQPRFTPPRSPQKLRMDEESVPERIAERRYFLIEDMLERLFPEEE